MIEKLDEAKKMFKYKINLNDIDRKDCGSTLTFRATGFKDWHNSSTIKIKCKSHNHFDYNYFLAHHFLKKFKVPCTPSILNISPCRNICHKSLPFTVSKT